ncbi:MAG: C10 family peptidase [Bacteroidales bacterium]|nr:C10 family peptidase [Bacteroidales bacterium]
MKRILLPLLLTLCMLPWGINAQQVNLQTAQAAAENFCRQNNILPSNAQLKYYCAANKDGFTSSTNETVDFYVFTSGENGFVVVSGDERVHPVLGYSAENRFDTTEMPDNIRWWLQNYQKELQILRKKTADDATYKVHPDWELLQQENVQTIRKTTASVSPLVKTQWNQNFPYSNLCPYDNSAGKYCPTGCVATAMAQILKFWDYPTKGTGSHKYTHSTYGQLSANFGSTTYQWSDMTNTYNKNSTSTAQSAVATLMYHCGVSVDMNYTPNSSGAYTLLTDDQVNYYNICDSRTALMRYFNCDTAFGFSRNNFDSARWVNLLKTELNAGRPFIYAGQGTKGGHAFVCDGYENEYYFHINWGWGGTSDGYFLISVMDPYTLGTGGGAGGFNSDQKVVFVWAKTDLTEYDLRLYSPLIMKDTLVHADSIFTITVNVANYGADTFEGDWGLAIYKENGTFVEYMDVKKDYQLESLYYDSLIFSSTRLNSSLRKGRYYATVCYKPKTSSYWKAVANNDYYQYENRINFTITSDENFYLQLYSNIHISENPVNYNTNFYFIDSIVNFGEKFSGYVAVALYNEQDSLLDVVASTSIELNYYYYISLTFNVYASSNLHSGNYVARIVYSTNGNKWKVIEGGNYTNKLAFSVIGRNLVLNKALKCNRDTLAFMEPFTITTTVKNNSPAAYNGNFALLAFDADGAFIDTIGLLTNVNVSARRTKELSFASDGTSSLRKGRTYSASLFYLDEYQEWSLVEGSSYPNIISLPVGDLDIDMTVRKMEISSNPIAYQSAFSFKASVNNAGHDTYHGAFKIFIYNNSGENVYNTDSIPYDLNYNTTVNLTYNLSYISALTLGDYTATIKYLEGDKWMEVPEGTVSPTISFRVSGTSVAERNADETTPYPNPTSDMIYLNLPEMATVQLSDATGKILLQKEMQGEEASLDLSGFNSGIYLLRIVTKQGVSHHAVIKQ